MPIAVCLYYGFEILRRSFARSVNFTLCGLRRSERSTKCRTAKIATQDRRRAYLVSRSDNPAGQSCRTVMPGNYAGQFCPVKTIPRERALCHAQEHTMPYAGGRRSGILFCMRDNVVRIAHGGKPVRSGACPLLRAFFRERSIRRSLYGRTLCVHCATLS